MSSSILSFSAAVLLMVSGGAAADRSWVINAGNLFVEEQGKPRRAVTLPGWQWAKAPWACAPAIAIGPRGEAVVTSNVLPVLWKVDPETLAVSVHRLQLDADADKDVGFSGLVYSERNGAYFAFSEQHGSVWRIDPLLRRAQKVALDERVQGGCAVSMQRQGRPSRLTKLCVAGKSVALTPDLRAAYVQPASCTPNTFALIGGPQ